jgi:hypothetical protein
MKPIVNEMMPNEPEVIIKRAWFVPIVKMAETTVITKNAIDNEYSV